MDKNTELKALADRILFGFHLSDFLHTIGKTHIIGSYKMNLMAIPDLNIAVENDEMSIEKLYKTTAHILNTIQPSTYEGKEFINKAGKKEWYFSFQKEIKSVPFNVDIRFISRSKIEAIEQFCEQIETRLQPQQRLATMALKQQLQANGLYGKSGYNCLDVYEAVISKNILSYDEFLNNYKKNV